MGRPDDCSCWCPDFGGGGDPDFFGCCNPDVPTAYWIKLDEDDDWEYRVDFYHPVDPDTQDIYPEIVFTHSGEASFRTDHFEDHVGTVYVKNILDDLDCGTFSESQFINIFHRSDPIIDVEPYNNWWHYGCFGIQPSSGVQSHFYTPSGWWNRMFNNNGFSYPIGIEVEQTSSLNSINIATVSGGDREWRKPNYYDKQGYYNNWLNNRYYRGQSTCPELAEPEGNYNIDGSGSWPRGDSGYMPGFYKKWNNPQAHSIYFVVSGVANTFEKSMFDISAKLRSRDVVEGLPYYWYFNRRRNDVRNYTLFENDGFGCCCDNYVLQFNSGVIEIPEENADCPTSGCLELEISPFYRHGNYYRQYLGWNRHTHTPVPNWGIRFFESESEYQSYLNNLDLISFYDALDPVGDSGIGKLENSILRSDLRNLSGIPNLTCLDGSEAFNNSYFGYPFSFEHPLVADRVNLSGFYYEDYHYHILPSGPDTQCMERIFQLGKANKDPDAAGKPPIANTSGILEGLTLETSTTYTEYELERNYCGGTSDCDYAVGIDVTWDVSGIITSLATTESGNFDSAMIYIIGSESWGRNIADCARLASGDIDYFNWAYAEVPKPTPWLVSGFDFTDQQGFNRRIFDGSTADETFNFIDTERGFSFLSADSVKFDPIFSSLGSGTRSRCSEAFAVDSGRQENLFTTFGTNSEFLDSQGLSIWQDERVYQRLFLTSPFYCSNWHAYSHFDTFGAYSSLCPDWYYQRFEEDDTPVDAREHYCKTCAHRFEVFQGTYNQNMVAYSFQLTPRNMLLLLQFWNDVFLLQSNERSRSHKLEDNLDASIIDDDLCLSSLYQSIFTELLLNLGATQASLDTDDQSGQELGDPHFGKYYFLPDQPNQGFAGDLTTLSKFYSPTCKCNSIQRVDVTVLTGTLEEIGYNSAGSVEAYYFSINTMKGRDRFTGEIREVGNPCNACNFHCGAGQFANCSDGERDSVHIALRALAGISFNEDDIGMEFTIANPPIDCAKSYLFEGWSVPDIQTRTSSPNTPEDCQTYGS